jgi:ribosome-binding factor A
MADDSKLKELLHKLAAEFFSRESNRQSLITITNVELINRGSKAKILITVLPESKEEAALGFIHRQLTELRQYVMEHSKIGYVPFFEVSIDRGEKNRQRLDDLTRKA